MDRKWRALIGPCQTNQVAVGSIRMILKLVLCFLKGSYVQILRTKINPALNYKHIYVARNVKVLPSKIEEICISFCVYLGVELLYSTTFLLC